MDFEKQKVFVTGKVDITNYHFNWCTAEESESNSSNEHIALAFTDELGHGMRFYFLYMTEKKEYVLTMGSPFICGVELTGEYFNYISQRYIEPVKSIGGDLELMGSLGFSAQRRQHFSLISDAPDAVTFDCQVNDGDWEDGMREEENKMLFNDFLVNPPFALATVSQNINRSVAFTSFSASLFSVRREKKPGSKSKACYYYSCTFVPDKNIIPVVSKLKETFLKELGLPTLPETMPLDLLAALCTQLGMFS